MRDHHMQPKRHCLSQLLLLVLSVLSHRADAFYVSYETPQTYKEGDRYVRVLC